MKIICGIYFIISPTGNVYVGQAVNILKRWKQYFRLDCKEQLALYNSFIKHGVHNHIFQIIEDCAFEDLDNKERFWQEFYNVLSPKGLNCRLTQTGTKKQVFSEEVREKIRKASTGRKHTEEAKEKIRQKAIGRKASEETKEKMSISSRIVSEETREKLRVASTGRKSSMKGKQMSEETKKKMSIAKMGNKSRTGEKYSEEQKLKLSLALKGKMSKEARESLSRRNIERGIKPPSQKGKKQSPEHIEKRRLSRIATLEKKKTN